MAYYEFVMIGFLTIIRNPIVSINCIRPKRADYYVLFLLANFATKNNMFNLNGSNRIVMAQHPTDMRMGVDCLSGQVKMIGLHPAEGDVYIFVVKSHQVMKNHI